MFFSKLKISAKLVISSAVFLIPIGVMIIFIWHITSEEIQKSMDQRDGLNSLKPVVTVMRNLPAYLNVYLGLEQGNLAQLDGQLTASLTAMDRELERYRAEGRELPRFLDEREALRRVEGDSVELYRHHLDFANSINNTITRIGEFSRLSLVTDMTAYYLVALALTVIPEASLRLISVGHLLRRNLHDGEYVIERWNTELAEAHTLGRRLMVRPFEGSGRDITVVMLGPADIQIVWNSYTLFNSDRDRVLNNLTPLMQAADRQDEFGELAGWLEQYQQTLDVLSGQHSRLFGFGIPNPSTAAEMLDTISSMNTYLCNLWDEVFVHLETHIQRNIRTAQRQLVIYWFIVLVSLGIALSFVVLITRDISRSVKTIKALFRGLNENDLTLSLQVNSKDEFGELMTAFNGFLNALRSTFGSFKKNTKLVADSVFDISSSSKEITTTANEQSASVSEIVSTMEGSKNLSEQIAFKTTEVAQLARETQELSSKGAGLREANQTMMEDIRTQNQKIISEIRNLSDMIVRISEAIRIIDGIADQTKLIAFNASLEASSSGEAGARFSVVASEIRRFADNVAESTREIKQKIEEVQGASQILITEANSGSRQIETGYERMSEQKIVFEQIVDNSQNVATRSQQISNLSKQQELASSQIFTALREISAGVKQFVVATSSTSSIADSLNSMSEELKGNVEKYRTER
ncbi:MAG: methyl-accepting chemotaxis protein [Treponema sp.]|nr:methyl-accepting chemotaxis protein [Treponema sp.]